MSGNSPSRLVKFDEKCLDWDPASIGIIRGPDVVGIDGHEAPHGSLGYLEVGAGNKGEQVFWALALVSSSSGAGDVCPTPLGCSSSPVHSSSRLLTAVGIALGSVLVVLCRVRYPRRR